MTICTVLSAAALLAATALAEVPTRLDMPLVWQATQDTISNHVISPFLVTNVLTQLWNGAEGTTREEIGRATGFSGYIAANSALSRTSNFTAGIFNGLYICVHFPGKGSFYQILHEIYGVDGKEFYNVGQAVIEINADVEGATMNRIKNIVNIHSLESAGLVLVSALYSAGPWKQMLTSIPPQPFLTAAGNNSVAMMQLIGRLEYNTFGDFDVVSLPYESDNYNLLIIRPLNRSLSAVQALHRRLRFLDIGAIYGQLGIMLHDVIVTMPNFAFESDLMPTLVNLGITKLFTPAANLSGISFEPLLLTEIVYKVFVEVNETGTEAAGVLAEAAVGLLRGVASEESSLPGLSTVDRGTEALGEDAPEEGCSPVDFTVDRPFLAVLYHNKLNLNLFSAWVANP